MNASPTTYYGLCPSCGEFDDLDFASGFCDQCHYEVVHDCQQCGNKLPANYTRRLCSSCRYERWLLRNADAVEYEMAGGISFAAAKEAVRTSNRPKCLSCGSVIYLAASSGTRAALFCKSTLECRRTRRHYFWLKEKGASKDDALNGALAEHQLRVIIQEVAT